MLHDLGNALNGINVSAGLARQALATSRGAGLDKLAGLLADHPDPSAFVRDDPRGQKLPVYLRELAKVLAEERATALKSVDAVRGGVEHVNAIVSAQHAQLDGASWVETFDIASAVDDALRFAAALGKHGTMSVERRMDSLPPITLDRSKLVRILANLLTNAGDAIAAKPEAERQIIVSAVASGGDRVDIAVEDNGIGIAAEDLELVFRMGYTSKPNAHGYGLHASACIAGEIGGALAVESGGRDRGARFVVSVPRAPAEANRGEGAGPDAVFPTLGDHRG